MDIRIVQIVLLIVPVWGFHCWVYGPAGVMGVVLVVLLTLLVRKAR